MKYVSMLLVGMTLAGCGSRGAVTETMADDSARGRIATAYDGPRIKVAVGRFEEFAGAKALFEQLEWPGMADLVTEQATTALVQTGRVAVLERAQLDRVIANINTETEGDKAAYFNQETTVKAGSFEGAQAVLIGSITEFEPNVSKSESSLLYKALAGLTFHEKRAVVGVELRIVDQTTGRIIVAASGRGDITQSKTTAGAQIKDVKIGTEKFARTPIGEALRNAVDDALETMIPKLPDIDWVGRIALANKKQVYIEGGSELNLKPGDHFQILRRGDEIRSAGGELIGHQETQIGMCTVISVQKKMTVAQIDELVGTPPAKGDLVRLPDGE
jgi:curli biogenesis system outer membrane secretion channel CsgG